MSVFGAQQVHVPMRRWSKAHTQLLQMPSLQMNDFDADIRWNCSYCKVSSAAWSSLPNGEVCNAKATHEQKTRNEKTHVCVDTRQMVTKANGILGDFSSCHQAALSA